MTTPLILIDRIKAQLKLKKVSYANLAGMLGVSEATVKRWFSTKAISLSSLDDICRATGISLEEMIRPQDFERQEYFNIKQEDLMFEDEKYMVVYYLIALGSTFDYIVDTYQFSEVELKSILIKLDKVELIELGKNNRYSIKVPLNTMWIPKGKLSRKYFHIIREDFMDSHFADKSEAHIFFSGMLSKEGAALIEKKIKKFREELDEIYKLDAKTPHTENISLFLGMRPWRFSIIQKYIKRNSLSGADNIIN